MGGMSCHVCKKLLDGVNLCSVLNFGTAKHNKLIMIEGQRIGNYRMEIAKSDMWQIVKKITKVRNVRWELRSHTKFRLSLCSCCGNYINSSSGVGVKIILDGVEAIISPVKLPQQLNQSYELSEPR